MKINTKKAETMAESQLIDIKLINKKKNQLLSTVNGSPSNKIIKNEIKKLTQKYYEKYGIDVRPKHY